MTIYDSLIAKAIGGSGGGGGGGSSDFSTAEVTIINGYDSEPVNATLFGVYGDQSADWGLDAHTLPDSIYDVFPEVDAMSDSTFGVVLYKGHGIMSISHIHTPTLSSGIALIIDDGDSKIYDITGDCTLTFSN